MCVRSQRFPTDRWRRHPFCTAKIFDPGLSDCASPVELVASPVAEFCGFYHRPTVAVMLRFYGFEDAGWFPTHLQAAFWTTSDAIWCHFVIV
jgi:hypothetical protein